MTPSPRQHPSAVGQHSDAFPPGMAARFFLVYAALFVPFAVATPFLQVLLKERGFSEGDIGLIQGILEVMAVLAPPLWGYFSDRTHARRVILAVVVVCMVPSFLLFGLVATLLPALMAAILFGLFSRPLIPLTDGLTFRHIHDHGGDYGRVRIGGSVAFMVTVVSLEWLGVSRAGGGRLILGAMAVAGLLQLLSVLALPRDESPLSAARTVVPRKNDLRLFLKFVGSFSSRCPRSSAA